jgi:hypothetical protein
MSILLAGLAIQALGLLAFLGTYRYFRHRLSHRRYILDDRFSIVFSSRRYTSFMVGTFGFHDTTWGGKHNTKIQQAPR